MGLDERPVGVFRRRRHAGDRQLEPERAALAGLAVDADATAVQADQVAAEAEAEPESALLLAVGGRHLVEALEQARQVALTGDECASLAAELQRAADLAQMLG